MNEHWVYASLMLFTLLGPLSRSFEKRIAYYRSFDSLIKAIAPVFVFFVGFDMLFTQAGIWGFNERYLLGWKLGVLPVEEVSFFILVPFACVFVQQVVDYFIPSEPPAWVAEKWAPFLVWFPLGLAVLNFGRWYTVFAMALLGLSFAWLHYKLRAPWLARFIRGYAWVLVPFLAINGVLTGTGLDEPVVWYNSDHHLNKRILSIPFEDAFYGMAMMLLVRWGYEHYEAKKRLSLT
jgi:lycopene cyclase domain-containing protein